MTNDVDKLGPKRLYHRLPGNRGSHLCGAFTGLIFKISVYLAIVIGVLVAVLLGIALLGRVIRLIFFGAAQMIRIKANL